MRRVPGRGGHCVAAAFAVVALGAVLRLRDGQPGTIVVDDSPVLLA